MCDMRRDCAGDGLTTNMMAVSVVLSVVEI
jgi:hypothetical protein